MEIIESFLEYGIAGACLLSLVLINKQKDAQIMTMIDKFDKSTRGMTRAINEFSNKMTTLDEATKNNTDAIKLITVERSQGVAQVLEGFKSVIGSLDKKLDTIIRNQESNERRNNRN